MNPSPTPARRSISGDIVTRRTTSGSRYRVTEGPVAPRRPAPQQPAPAPRRPTPPALDLRKLEPRVARRPLWSGPAAATRQAATPVRPQTPPVVPPAAAPKAPSPQATTPPQWPARLWNLAQYPIIAAAALIAAFNVQLGQLFVLAWGAFALIRRLDPRYSFGAALFVLITIPLFQALGRAGIAENAAVYVYELLVVGTISALIALRKSE